MNKNILFLIISFSTVMFLPVVARAENEGSEHNAACRIVLDMPHPSAPLLFPLHVEGKLLGESSTCQAEWMHSETELGNIFVVDADGKHLTEEEPIPVSFTPPVTYPLSFSLTLRLADLAPQTATGKIVIIDREVTESDGDEQHSVGFPVKFTNTTETSHFFTKKLKYGMRNNPDVKKLQEVLYKRGYLTDTPNGNFLSKTKKALIQYQKEHGLPATGICGDMTRQLLNDHE